jgi:hypothetical protein
MIATRQRKQKKGSLLPVLLPIAAIVMLIVALTWPPSRNFIANGPLHPVVATLDNVWSVISRPLTFDYQEREITDRNRQIRDLNDKLEADRKSSTGKDSEIQQLQKQIAALQAQPEASPSASAGPIAAVAAGATGAAPGAGRRGDPAYRPAVGRHGSGKGRGPRSKAAGIVRRDGLRPDVARCGRPDHGCAPARSGRPDRPGDARGSRSGGSEPIAKICRPRGRFFAFANRTSVRKGGER